MTGILNGFDTLKVFICCTYESSWNFPLIRHTWMLDAFPMKHFDIKKDAATKYFTLVFISIWI